ncbi:hypothetical protein DZS_43940 [Dickeya ananatis]
MIAIAVFFLAQHASQLGELVAEVLEQAEDPLYRQLAERRITRQLPEQFSEMELMLEFSVTRPVLRKVLLRCQQEGWLEHMAGQGWRTLPVIDSVEAYEESYALRAIIEPAGLLSATFHITPHMLAHCRRQQEYLAEDGYLTMTAMEMFDTSSGFHDTLAVCSGNRFFAANRSPSGAIATAGGVPQRKIPPSTQASGAGASANYSLPGARRSVKCR